jgi:hypothetical protein
VRPEIGADYVRDRVRTGDYQHFRIRFRNENVLKSRTKVSVHYVQKKIESSFNQFLYSRIQNMQVSPKAQVDHSTVHYCILDAVI